MSIYISFVKKITVRGWNGTVVITLSFQPSGGDNFHFGRMGSCWEKAEMDGWIGSSSSEGSTHRPTRPAWPGFVSGYIPACLDACLLVEQPETTFVRFPFRWGCCASACMCTAHPSRMVACVSLERRKHCFCFCFRVYSTWMVSICGWSTRECAWDCTWHPSWSHMDHRNYHGSFGSNSYGVGGYGV